MTELHNFARHAQPTRKSTNPSEIYPKESGLWRVFAGISGDGELKTHLYAASLRVNPGFQRKKGFAVVAKPYSYSGRSGE